MKVVLILVLSIASSFAGSWRRGAAVPVAAGITYIFNEDFEGTGSPAGWSNFGVDPDSTTSPLVGAQSLRTTAGGFLLYDFAGATTVHVKFRYRPAALPGTSDYIFLLLDTGFGNSVYVLLMSDGTLTISDGAATIFGQTVSAMSAGTIYDVWVDVVIGSGANGVATVGFATAGGAKPTSGNNFAGASNGSNTVALGEFHLGGNSTITADYDTTQASASVIP